MRFRFRHFPPCIAPAATVSACLLGGGAFAQNELPAVPPEYREAYGAVLRNPGDVQRLYELARRAEVDAAEGAPDPRSRYLFALRLYDRYQLLRPNDTAVALRKGEIHYTIGEPEAAEDNFRQALADPSLAPDIRREARGYLAEIERETSSDALFGSVSFGLRHQTNATAGPSQNLAEFEDLVLEEDATDAFLSFAVTHRVGPDWRGRWPELETRFEGYGSEFIDFEEASTQAAELSFGPRFRFATRGGPSSVRPYAIGKAVGLDGDLYMAGGGFGIEADLQTGSALLWSADLRGTYDDFRESDDEPGIDARDGQFYQARLELVYRASAAVGLQLALEGDRREARDASETYTRLGAELGGIVLFNPPFGGQQKWSTSLTAGLYEAEYGDQPGEDREDSVSWARLAVEVPVAAQISGVGSVRYFDRDSSLPQYDSDNVESAAFVTVRF